MIPLLLSIYELGSEVLVKGLEITEQYILLAPEAVLKGASQMISALTSLLGGNLRREVSGRIVRLSEVLLQMAQELGGASGVQMVTGILVETQFLARVLTGIKSAHDAHQTTGPYRARTDVEGLTETDYLAVLARILWSSPQTFVEAMLVAAAAPFDTTMAWLPTEWFSHFQEIGNTERKKLMTLALTKLFELELGKPILDRLQDYLATWTDVVMECMEYEEDGSGEGKDCLVYTDIDSLKWEGVPEAPEDERRRKVSLTPFTPLRNESHA